MKEFLYKLWSRFLTQFGKIKVMTFSFIPILAYETKPYVVDGYDVQGILHGIRPGDILIRGYDCYLDGRFIPDEHGYSHAGVYVGNNEVIHAVSPCVSKTHLIDFCQSDRIMVLRCEREDLAANAVDIATSKLGIPYDFNYEDDYGKLYCFELAVTCYPDIKFKTFEVKKFFGLIKRDCYLAQSLYDEPSFKKMFEKNEKA